MIKKILIIKHGSFGDIILATSVFKTIKNNYPKHRIYLLTTSKNIKFISKSKYFYKILVDDRKSILNFLYNFSLLIKIKKLKFEYIIDVQNSKRTMFYNIFFRIFCKSIISSSRPFAHKRYIIPKQGKEHSVMGLKKQLLIFGIKKFYQPDLEWLTTKKRIKYFKKPYAIFIPGTSKNGQHRQWPSENYAKLAKILEEKKINVLVVGTKQDYLSAQKIFKESPNSINLLGKSPPEILFKLAKNAKFAISNDTGPAFLVALAKTPLIRIVKYNNLSLSNTPIGAKVYNISSLNIRNIKIIKIINLLKKHKLI